MKFKLLNEGAQKTFAIILDNNEHVMACLKDFAVKHNIHAAQFTAIGALRQAVLGFFKFDMKDYKKIYIDEQTEVLNMSGDISIYKNEPMLHVHVVLGKEDGTAHGGHLMEGIVHPTLEVILTESAGHLNRQMDDSVGIPLIKI
jgi:predicted DNA-binding protein with PD1-like motif